MRKGKPRISVIIPAYNEEKNLPQTLSSLKNQDFSSFEVIVVDNNSTDKTPQIAQSFGAKVVKEERKGIIYARQKGFKAAQGEIIARLDADTFVPENWLRKIYGRFKKEKETVALTGNLVYAEFSPFLNRIFQFLLVCYYQTSKFFLGHFPLVGGNQAIRKSALRKIRVHLDDKLVHEDIDLSCHLSQVGRIVFCPEITATTSCRRWRENFWPTLFDYSRRYLQTILLHSPYRQFHQKILAKVRKSSQFFLAKKKVEN